MNRAALTQVAGARQPDLVGWAPADAGPAGGPSVSRVLWSDGCGSAMQVGVIGAGYVGLVAACALAAAGHDVVCAEIDADRRAALTSGRCPVHEPGLADLLGAVVAAGRLRVVASASAASEGAEVVFIAVGTPRTASGGVALAGLEAAVASAAAAAPTGAVIAVKSTCPPGTVVRLGAEVAAGGRPDVTVVSNPEFLVEGDALRGFRTPSRVVIGGPAPGVARLRALYATLTAAPVVEVDSVTAEIGKLLSNTMLAARVALMNEAAGLADALGGDVAGVAEVVGSDPRIGPHHLRAGPGFGGGCLPKDVAMLAGSLAAADLDPSMASTLLACNARHTARVLTRLLAVTGWGTLEGRRVAAWGLAFKAGTDDVRASPAVAVVEALVAGGADVRVWDAAAPSMPGVVAAPTPLDALDDADALVVLTEWPTLRAVSPLDMARRMRHRIVLDARDVLDRSAMSAAGFLIAGIGRPTLRPAVEPD